MRPDEIRTKAKLIVQLGGKCVVCGTTENLEFDHIDPRTKTHPITRIMHQQKLYEKEILLCQLLCNSCHKKKSAQELSEKLTKPIVHGTLSGHKKCGPVKCTLCRRV